MGALLDTIDCLSNSSSRLSLLRALEDTRKSVGELKDELDIPRTTLKRNLSILQKRDWVTEDRSSYRTTTTGSLILREIQLLGQRLERIQRLEPFLAAVTSPDDINIHHLQDIRLTVPEPDEPYRASNRLLETLDNYDHSRSFMPIMSSQILDWLRESNRDIECIISSQTLARLTERRDDEVFDAPISVNQTILCYDGELPYGLFVSDNHVSFVAYGAKGRIEALVESQTSETINWSTDLYTRYRQTATPVTDMEVAQ